MSYEVIFLEFSGHLATITLNNPDRLNAISSQMAPELHEALDEVAGEFPEIRALIITGAGRGFCSGADVSQQTEDLVRYHASAKEGEAYRSERTASIVTLAPHIRRLPQATIAAVNGTAVGAGLSLALACDIRIASETARFSSIFIKRSLMMDTGASYTLPSVVGMGTAAEMALTGRIYDVQWALRVGLVNSVVPGESLIDAARALGEEIAANPPLAVQATKQLLYSHDADLDQVIWTEQDAARPLRTTEDRQEAADSFREKRQPVYKGR